MLLGQKGNYTIISKLLIFVACQALPHSMILKWLHFYLYIFILEPMRNLKFRETVFPNFETRFQTIKNAVDCPSNSFKN